MKLGSLFSGYGGLEMGIGSVLDARTVWHSEIDQAPSRILAHHWPDIPNLGDITAIDWATVEPVDILCGGFPCQDVSVAGLRRGLHPDTRSGLWSHFALAIDALRPNLVIVENVRGLLSAEAHSDLEPEPWDLGEPARDRGPVLRALGAILGDLADLGYDAEWHGVRAADAGAPHGRFRVFLTARPADTDRGRHGIEQDPRRVGRMDQHDAGEARERERARELARDRSDAVRFGPDAIWTALGGAPLTPHPTHDRHERITHPGTGQSITRGSTHRVQGHRESTVRVRPGTVGTPTAHRVDWGAYGPTIRRWERVIDRVAPSPTETSSNGNPRLSPAFVEWMMGLPVGHVTDVGLTRNEQLKALGNGVVPQQAALALRTLLARQEAAA